MNKGKRKENQVKIKVVTEAFYGVCCHGCGCEGSEKEHEVMVSQRVYNALKEIGEDEVTSEDVEEAIESGKRNLKKLHKHLGDLFYEMVAHYWLYESDHSYIDESLECYILDDIKNGLYVEEEDDDVYDYWADEDETKDDDNIDSYRLHKYGEWVLDGTHDNDFVAERIGCDISDIRDEYDVEYTIFLKEEDEENEVGES